MQERRGFDFPGFARYARPFAAYWREALLVLVSIALTLVVSEIGYRLYQYQTLPGQLFALVKAQLPTNYGARTANSSTQLLLADAHTGYVYAPNFEGTRGHPWHSRFRTNSHGHVSKFEYPRQKPAGEYRIAVIGNSFTANITNNVRWTEVLEELLNASPQWRQQVGDRFTRVINFGVDGTGMIQFAAMVRHHAMTFDPNLIIVNFISDSILRRLRYVGVPAHTNDQTTMIRAYVRNNYLARIDWFNPCPELIVAVAGRLWGQRCMLPLDARDILANEPTFRFSDRLEAINASIASVKDMMSVFKDILLLQMPTFPELENHRDTLQQGLADALRAALPQARIVSMRPQMDALLEGKRFRDRPDLTGRDSSSDRGAAGRSDARNLSLVLSA